MLLPLLEPDYRRLGVRILLGCYFLVSPRLAGISSAMASGAEHPFARVARCEGGQRCGAAGHHQRGILMAFRFASIADPRPVWVPRHVLRRERAHLHEEQEPGIGTINERHSDNQLDCRGSSIHHRSSLAEHQAQEMTGMKNRNSNENCVPSKTRGMLPMAGAAARLILLSGDVSVG
jgi:hypothetical protein